MLSITIPKTRLYNEESMEFFYLPEQTIRLEHSLLSIRRWESKWHKSYLQAAATGLTIEENLDYIRCMCLDQNVDPKTLRRLTKKNFEDIVAYINDPMTATTFRETGNTSRKQQTITAELLYCNMIECGIPLECEKWHLNQLLTLIRVCSIRNSAQTKKRSPTETAAMYKALNEARRKKTGSRG